MEFNLQEGEKILLEFKPVPSYKLSMFLGSIFGGIIFLIFFGLWIGLFMGMVLQDLMAFFWTILILIIFFAFIVPYYAAKLQYEKRKYWISNKRVIIKRGFIGYSINSIPFERISDVLISRSFWESLFGFGSVNIQSLAGQMTYTQGGKAGSGAEGAIEGITNPEELQKTIFDLISKNRKAQKLSM